MKDHEENGYIEAKIIVDEAYGDLVCDKTEIDFFVYAEACEKLLGASGYLEEQIPLYLRGTY